jgi:hypothetical protein
MILTLRGTSDEGRKAPKDTKKKKRLKPHLRDIAAPPKPTGAANERETGLATG